MIGCVLLVRWAVDTFTAENVATLRAPGASSRHEVDCGSLPFRRAYADASVLCSDLTCTPRWLCAKTIDQYRFGLGCVYLLVVCVARTEDFVGGMMGRPLTWPEKRWTYEGWMTVVVCVPVTSLLIFGWLNGRFDRFGRDPIDPPTKPRRP